ncbi:YjgB family protein [Neobacillus vireti]|uniref:YjgB family protein n=1 Tax=Neobacillus vireti TaxID=220686 RepID=UPI001F3992F9|nr:YjgB family protein [Neobacillus vireti]
MVKASFISCLLILLVGCTGNQESQATTSPPKQSTPSPSPSPPNQNQQNNEPKNPANNQSNPQENAVVNKNAALIHEIVSLAKVGTVKNCSFPAHTTVIDQVISKWGTADQQDFVAGNRYFTYTSHGIVFGVNKGEQIFDVRSYSKEIQQITFDEIKDVLGKPNEVHNNGADKIWVYNVNEKFQLKFVGSKTTIDHILVFCPADAKNQMAG